MIDLTIFFDVDGVLINWLTPFHMFLREHGHAALGATEHRYPTLSAVGSGRTRWRSTRAAPSVSFR